MSVWSICDGVLNVPNRFLSCRDEILVKSLRNSVRRDVREKSDCYADVVINCQVSRLDRFMLRFCAVLVVFGVLGVVLSAVTSTGSPVQLIETPPTANGVVFHDANSNRMFDAGEQVLPGIRVSNGSQIVQTDQNGRYEISIEDDTTLFVIKPRNWRTPLDETLLPVFYYHHKPHGSPQLKYAGVEPTGPLPESVDFPLYPQTEPDDFKAILFGDPQPRDQSEVDFIAHDVVEELVGTDASFGVTLGDIAFDNLETMPALNKTIALLGIPWYNVIGNHDINYDARTRKLANETYERIYGPSYYSFDYGPVHFLVLDDIEWNVQENGRGSYRGGIGPEQLEFIKTDLTQIPESQMVVLMMHIPIVDVHDRHGLYRLIEQRSLCISISGHTHTHEHVWISKADGWEGPQPHHHIVNVTVCGSWWSGAPDERGIPHSVMADGGPNGYSILNFNGGNYWLDYHSAGRGSDYQMEIDAPEVVNAADAASTPIYVNFFNGDEHSVVKLRVDNEDWSTLEHVREADPKYVRTFEKENMILEKDSTLWRKLPKPGVSTHLWKGMLPAHISAGTQRIDVQAVDRHGRAFDDHRIIRVEE